MEQRQANNNSEEGRNINAYLKQVEATIFQYYQQLRADRKQITADGLKNAYLGLSGVEEVHTLLQLVQLSLHPDKKQPQSRHNEKIIILPRNTSSISSRISLKNA